MEPDTRHRGHGGGCGLATLIICLLCVALMVYVPSSRGQGIYTGLSALPGDADCDGQITVSDLVALVHHIFDARPLPAVCQDTTVIFSDSLLTIKRLMIPVDSTVHAGNYFSQSVVQKYLLYESGVLVDSAMWLYQVLPISLNHNIPPAESLKVEK